MTFRAHFDGTVIVPDEPVDFPVDAPLKVEAIPADGEPGTLSPLAPDVIARRLAAFERFRARTANDPVIPLEYLRREHLYD